MFEVTYSCGLAKKLGVDREADVAASTLRKPIDDLTQALRRPAATCDAINSSRPGSRTGLRPAAISPTLNASVSTTSTVCWSLAKHAALTHPT